MVNQNNSVSLAKFLGVVLFVFLWIYLGDELIYPLSYWVFFLIPENQKIQIYSSSLFPFIYQLSLGFPLQIRYQLPFTKGIKIKERKKKFDKYIPDKKGKLLGTLGVP